MTAQRPLREKFELLVDDEWLSPAGDPGGPAVLASTDDHSPATVVEWATMIGMPVAVDHSRHGRLFVWPKMVPLRLVEADS